MSNSCADLIEHINFILHARKLLRAKGPHFRIIHQLHAPGSDCAPGEEIVAAFLGVRGKEFRLPISGALLLLFDYLARHTRLPQTARQIVRGIEADSFYHEHGSNAPSQVLPPRRINLSEVRVYLQRLRIALGKAFHEAGIRVDAAKVLVVEETLSNRPAYRLKGSFEWLHTDYPSEVETDS